ncbi:hypothetical protein Tco_0739950 [Tanacetum coccineum]
MAVNGGQRRSTVANHREPPSDHHRTIGQRWLTASQRVGLGQRLPRGIHVAADVAERIIPSCRIEPMTLRYQVERYNEGIVHSYEQRLETIWGRSVNRVHVLDFAGLTDGMRQTLADRLGMVYTGDDEQALFTTHTIKIRGPLVREFMLEFFSTCRMSDTEIRLDVADMLCFQLGGARRRMT